MFSDDEAEQESKSKALLFTDEEEEKEPTAKRLRPAFTDEEEEQHSATRTQGSPPGGISAFREQA